MMTDILLCPACPADLPAILDLNRLAFGGEAEAELVEALLADPAAAPLVNLVLFQGDILRAHVLLSRGWLDEVADGPALSWLAPLAVHPERQGRGLGQALTHAASAMAAEMGQALIFLMGHPGFYPKCGYVPAGAHGFTTPHPLPDGAQPAWMVRELQRGALSHWSGRVRASEPLERPELWGS